MAFLESLWWVLVLIGIMIMIHELGHFLAARYFDVKVETFSFGFGPRLVGFRRGDTDYRLSAILFGGYVKMSGEQAGDGSPADDPRSFLAKPRWQRLIIAFAGPFMNIVLAVGILTGLYMFKFPKIHESSIPGMVGVVLPNSAAAKAGIQEGDRIIAIDGIKNPTWEDIFLKEIPNANQSLALTLVRDGQQIETTITPEMDARTGVGTSGWAEQAEVEIAGVDSGHDAERQGLRAGDILLNVNGQPIRSAFRLREIIKASQGRPVEVVYSRNGAEHTATVTPSLRDDNGQKSYRIGVSLEPRVTFVPLSFPDALVESLHTNRKSATLIYEFLQGIIRQRMSARSLEGPIGIARLSSTAAKQGPAAFLDLMSTVSLNLAIFNLLPIPILDGGLILMLFVEMFIRRDLSLQVKETVVKFGFVFLMAVVAFVLYNDISKILPQG